MDNVFIGRQPIYNAKLETSIMQDVTMSLRLLRYINSAQFGLRHEIDSLKQAIMMLGHNTIRSLMALAQIDDKPHELLITALTRAKMAEQLGGETQFPEQ